MHKILGILQVTLPHHEGDPPPRQIIEAKLGPYVSFAEEREDNSATVEIQTPSPSSHSTEKPQVVHGSFFLIDFYDDIRDDELQSTRIFQCNTSNTELKDHVKKAREIFSQMYPQAEFLPKAPQPEDVDMEDDREDLDDDNEGQMNPPPERYGEENGVPQ